MVRVEIIHYMVRVMIIRSYDKELWIIRRGGQSTSRVFRGNIYGIWKQIRGIAGSLIWAGTIINENGREIQSWDIKTI